MNSFFTLKGERVIFESRAELSLYTSKDIVSSDITGYFVELLNGPSYEVDETTYNSLLDM